MNEKRKAVVKKIMDKIHSGEIVAGDRLLPERQLSAIVGVTRPVLREGLIALDAMGVIEIRDRQGIFLSVRGENNLCEALNSVMSWPADTFSRLMEVRQIVEPAAAGLAAARRSDGDLAKMRECLEHFKELATQTGADKDEEGTCWNTAFHVIIVGAAYNTYLSRIYETIYSLMERQISFMRINTPSDDLGGRMTTYMDHSRLYALIEAGDSAGAELTAEKHLINTISAMIKLGQLSSVSDLLGQGFVGRRRLIEKLRESAAAEN